MKMVKDYAKVSNTGMKNIRGKPLCEKGEVKLQMLLGSTSAVATYEATEATASVKFVASVKVSLPRRRKQVFLPQQINNLESL